MASKSFIRGISISAKPALEKSASSVIALENVRQQAAVNENKFSPISSNSFTNTKSTAPQSISGIAVKTIPSTNLAKSVSISSTSNATSKTSTEAIAPVLMVKTEVPDEEFENSRIDLRTSLRNQTSVSNSSEIRPNFPGITIVSPVQPRAETVISPPPPSRVLEHEYFSRNDQILSIPVLPGDIISTGKEITLAEYCYRNLVHTCANVFSLKCSICKLRVRIRFRRSSNGSGTLAIHHVLTHMTISPLQCRYCALAVRDIPAMISHLQEQHRMDLTKSCFIDRTQEYRSEIIPMIERCFPIQQRLPQKKVIKKYKPRRPKPPPPENTVDIRKAAAHCFSLMKCFSLNGQLHCRLCRNKIGVRDQVRGKHHFVMGKAIDHAWCHLGEPATEKSTCCCGALGQGAFVHIRSCKYYEEAVKKLNSFGTRYESKLISMLSNCFDKDQPSEEVRWKGMPRNAVNKRPPGKDVGETSILKKTRTVEEKTKTTPASAADNEASLVPNPPESTKIDQHNDAELDAAHILTRFREAPSFRSAVVGKPTSAATVPRVSRLSFKHSPTWVSTSGTLPLRLPISKFKMASAPPILSPAPRLPIHKSSAPASSIVLSSACQPRLAIVMPDANLINIAGSSSGNLITDASVDSKVTSKKESQPTVKTSRIVVCKLKHVTTKIFKCVECGMHFRHEKLMKNHAKLAHKK